ncbi:MAG: amidohydrolase family protein, partial [Ferruginibacter sp.]
MRFSNLFYALMFLVFLSSCKFRQKADLVVHHALIYTVDNNFSVAQAMAINAGKIIAIGSNDDILKDYEPETSVDAKGKAVYPGFIDAHCHFTGFATDMWKCSLVGTTSFEEIVEKLKIYSTETTTDWIYGRGWDQNDWQVKEFPDKRMLDSLFPNRPVFLKRIDGHAALVNQAALNMAGINVETKISGGSIEIKDGKLTGILIDNAMDIVDNKIP